jgi:hypothetical protein
MLIEIKVLGGIFGPGILARNGVHRARRRFSYVAVGVRQKR